MSFCIPVFQVEVVEQGGAFSGLDDSAAEIQAYQIGIESHMDPDNCWEKNNWELFFILTVCGKKGLEGAG